MEFMNEVVPDSSLITFSGSMGIGVRSAHAFFWCTTAVKEQVEAHLSKKMVDSWGHFGVFY